VGNPQEWHKKSVQNKPSLIIPEWGSDFKKAKNRRITTRRMDPILLFSPGKEGIRTIPKLSVIIPYSSNIFANFAP